MLVVEFMLSCLETEWGHNMGIKEWFTNLKRNVLTLDITPQGEHIPILFEGHLTASKKNEPISEKDAATAKGEPWVNVIGIELDADNLGNGNFTLDWNDKFVANLVRAGYKGKDDITIVDQWFAAVCRNVLEENYEQGMADPTNRTEFNAQFRNSTKK